MFQLSAFIDFEDDDLRSDQWALVRSACRNMLFVRRLQDIDASLASTVDSIVVKLGTKIDPSAMDRLPRLRCIFIFGTDRSDVSREYAAGHGILVHNLEDYSTNGVAEFQFACILTQVRDLHKARANAAQGEYSEDGFTGRELHGRALGVVGFGHIGKRVAEIAKHGFQMEVSYWSRSDWQLSWAQYVSLDQLFGKSEVISINVELNSETRGMISRHLLAMVRDGATIISTVPIPVFEWSGLVALLSSGRASVILDHADDLSTEECKTLASYSNCMLYPAIGYKTSEATRLKQEMLVEKLLQASQLAGP
jgi:phosphoglycerate dehydrogenase-like enzyme